MSIQYLERIPDQDEYWKLFEETKWNEVYGFSPDELTKAILNSWYAVSAYHSEKLVGFGRVISDGVHHALIVDMIVAERFQGMGIGKTIVQMLTKMCVDHRIRDIQLFAAKNKFGFYEKQNFVKRPENAPGMQYEY